MNNSILDNEKSEKNLWLKTVRLKGSEIHRTRLQGTRFFKDGLTFWALKSDLGYARMGVLVGKKVYPRAVDRNYFKRIQRCYFQKHHQELGSVDLVVAANSHLKKVKTTELNSISGSAWYPFLASLQKD